jgi:hypothetical protein
VADTAKPKEPRTAVTNRVSPLGASPHIREMSGDMFFNLLLDLIVSIL